METWKILAVIGGIFIAIPFLIWGYCRFRSKVQQKFATWHKPLIFGSFMTSLVVVLICFLLAFLI